MSVKMTEQNSTGTTADLSSNLLKRIQNYAFGTKHSIAEEIGETNEDLIYQLRTNIARLEDASLRLDFMMDEISSLIRKSVS